MSERRTVTIRDIKSGSSDDLLEIVDEAASNGVTVLQVLNRGRAILFLGPEEVMPEKWRAIGPATVPISSLKKEKISLTELQEENTPLILSLRSGKTLALWPIEDDPRSELDRLADRVDYLEGRLGQIENFREEELAEALKKLKRTADQWDVFVKFVSLFGSSPADD